VIVIVDYGMGNLRSVQKALERVGGEARVSDRPEDVARAERLVVPGVGAFGDAMRALEERGLVEPIREFVRRGRPVLGICLGLQIFFEESEETGAAEGAAEAPARGLALFKGRVVRFGDPSTHSGSPLVRPTRREPLGRTRGSRRGAWSRGDRLRASRSLRAGLCPSTSLRAARAWSRGCVSAVNCRAVCSAPPAFAIGYGVASKRGGEPHCHKILAHPHGGEREYWVPSPSRRVIIVNGL